MLRVDDVTVRARGDARPGADQGARTTDETRPQIVQLADVFRARVVDVSPESLIVEITGSEAKLDGLLDVLQPYGVLEMVRTGTVAMSRGEGAAAAPAVPHAGTAHADSEEIAYSV